MNKRTENIKVSVVMPIYNGEKYLRETIDSVLNQSLSEFELICVDDGSTDSTVSILEEYQKNDDRIVMIRQENQFAGIARNRGIEKASGKYLVCWDSDDYFDPTALETMYEKCEKEHAEICICAVRHFEGDIKKAFLKKNYLREEFLPEKEVFGHEDIDRYLYNFTANAPWNKMYLRQMILDNEIHFQHYHHGEDTMFVMMALYYAKTFTVVRKPLIYYRIFNDNSLTGHMSQWPMEVMNSYKDTYRLLSREKDFVNVKQSFYNKFVAGMVNDLKNIGEYKDFKKSFQMYQELLVEWDFPQNEEYYIFHDQFRRFMDVYNGDTEGYLLHEYRMFVKKHEYLYGANSRKKQRIEKMSGRIEKKDDKISRLQEEITRLQEEVEKKETELGKIKTSRSYKLGLALTKIPRKLKKMSAKK